jgi:hypothetical protein
MAFSIDEDWDGSSLVDGPFDTLGLIAAGSLEDLLID